MAVTVITRYDLGMGRWQPGAGGRLEKAALELYSEHGYDATTVAEIAERAGLTERTFFRHYADKREVLFAGATVLQDLLVGRVLAAPAALTPLDAIADALVHAAVVVFEERRDFVRLRQAIVAANPELQERELIKLASLASALADALRERGVSEPGASLAAEAGIAVFKIAFEHWVSDSRPSTLAQHIEESMAELRLVTAGLPVADRADQPL